MQKLMPLVKSSRALILLLIAASSCVSATPTFNWHPTIYAADSRTQTISRKVNGKIDEIETKSPRFDGFVCVPIAQPREAFEACQTIIERCETWKSP